MLSDVMSARDSKVKLYNDNMLLLFTDGERWRKAGQEIMRMSDGNPILLNMLDSLRLSFNELLASVTLDISKTRDSLLHRIEVDKSTHIIKDGNNVTPDFVNIISSAVYLTIKSDVEANIFKPCRDMVIETKNLLNQAEEKWNRIRNLEKPNKKKEQIYVPQPDKITLDHGTKGIIERLKKTVINQNFSESVSTLVSNPSRPPKTSNFLKNT